MRQTSTQRLASLLLDQPVEKWIQARRDLGDSWRLISIELHDRTSGQVSVTGEAIRQWASRRAAAKAGRHANRARRTAS